MRRTISLTIATAAVLAAIAIVLAPRPRGAPTRPASAWRPRHTIVAGAFHVHTDRSPDGSASIEDAAAAAGRAGLQFVVATEHGDGTTAPLPPTYHGGVLWIDGTEISTSDGHYATFGLPQSPYPLAGDARDVAEDVARLGGTGVAAHGDSQKAEAQWRDWNAPIDGIEWLNLDSVWRDAGVWKLARASLTYWFRPAATLDALASRPVQTLAHVDAVAASRRIFLIAASDAHGRRLPSYDACFGAFSTRVELDRGLTGDAGADAAAILSALRSGHHYTLVDALAPAGAFEFTARSGNAVVAEGDAIPEGQPVEFDIHVAGPPDATAVLFRNGVPIEDSRSPVWTHGTEGTRAEYRVEVTLPSSPGSPPLPWIVSNPIYVGEAAPAPETGRKQSSAVSGPPFEWQLEKDAATVAEVTRSGTSAVRLRYQLARGAPANQFAAAVAAVAGFAGADGVAFTGRASRPLRLSVELRGDGDRRWQRSIYLDTTPRSVRVSFDDMRPVTANTPPHPSLRDVRALMLLVGVSNTTPGTAGEIEISQISLLG